MITDGVDGRCRQDDPVWNEDFDGAVKVAVPLGGIACVLELEIRRGVACV